MIFTSGSFQNIQKLFMSCMKGSLNISVKDVIIVYVQVKEVKEKYFKLIRI